MWHCCATTNFVDEISSWSNDLNRTLACVALGRDLFKSRIEAQIKKRASLRTSNKRCHDPSQTTGSTDSPRTPHNLPQFNKVPDHGVAPERQG